MVGFVESEVAIAEGQLGDLGQDLLITPLQVRGRRLRALHDGGAGDLDLDIVDTHCRDVLLGEVNLLEGHRVTAEFERHHDLGETKAGLPPLKRLRHLVGRERGQVRYVDVVAAPQMSREGIQNDHLLGGRTGTRRNPAQQPGDNRLDLSGQQ